jgi:hypothetical protein
MNIIECCLIMFANLSWPGQTKVDISWPYAAISFQEVPPNGPLVKEGSDYIYLHLSAEGA